ncbi:MAG: SpoIIIAH-like family protein [bacterium]
MIKKNKLSLFLLAVVMMLSIYYINMPEEGIIAPTVSENITTEHPEFASMRLEILAQREEYVVDLENIIASDTYSDDMKSDAFETMQEILELTELEVLAETFVENLGYLDCFVVNEDNFVSVYILNYVPTTQEFIEITSIMKDVFGSNIKVEVSPKSI